MKAMLISLFLLLISGLLISGYFYKSNLKPPLFTIQNYNGETIHVQIKNYYWDQYKDNEPTSFGDNYFIYDNGRGLSFKAPKKIKLRFCDSIVPSDVKITENKKDSIIYLYTENSSSKSKECSDEFMNFYFTEYKGKNELEKIIQKHFGENCKITGFKIDKIKNIKYPIFDKSYEQLPEFKEKGMFSGVACQVGHNNGYYLSVNLKENVVFWIDSPMQVATFIDVNDNNKTLDLYENLIIKSIVLK